MGLEIINRLKKEKGYTTEQLSRLSGVPVGTLNKILNGATKDPKLETLKALSKVLGCSLNDFGDYPPAPKLDPVYLRLAKDAQDKKIHPDDIAMIMQIIADNRKQ